MLLKLSFTPVKLAFWPPGSRRGANGGEVEVAELGPKWLKVVPVCSLIITDASPTLGCAK